MLTYAISHCIAYLVQLYGSHYILQNQKRKQKRIKNKKIGFILGVINLFLKNERRKKDEVK